MKSKSQSKLAHILHSGPAFLLSGLLLTGAGCATQAASRAIQPGDIADIHFLCRLSTGEVVAASDSVPQDLQKSNVFEMRKGTAVIKVSATRPGEELTEKKEDTFEEMIAGRLAGMIFGMKEGETRQVELKEQDISEPEEKNEVARLSRVRKRPKEIRMPLGDYRFRSGKTPEVGQTFVLDPAFPGKVESVNDRDVVIRFSAKPGELINTPFGPGLIREEGDMYLVDIDARKGSLVRTANLIGRITDVDDKVITIDYRHLFGGEKLLCDVAVENISRGESAQKEKGD